MDEELYPREYWIGAWDTILFVLEKHNLDLRDDPYVGFIKEAIPEYVEENID